MGEVVSGWVRGEGVGGWIVNLGAHAQRGLR